MPIRMQQLVAAALLIVLAVMLTIFACTLVPGPKSALIAMALVFYIFAPLPFAVCSNVPQANDLFAGAGNQGAHPLVAIGHFATGMFFTAGPCTALVLYHIDAISLGSMFMSFGSGVFVVAALYMLSQALSKPEEDADF